MISLAVGGIGALAVIGAHCDDIVIGAGATLIEIDRHNPGVVINALVLTGAGTQFWSGGDLGNIAASGATADANSS